FRDLGRTLKQGARLFRDAAIAVLHYWPVLVAVIAVFVALTLLRRRRGRAMESGRPRSRPRARSPIAQIYDQALRQLAKARIARDPATTPGELADGVTSPIAPQVGELTELYYAAEWGGRSEPADLQRAEQLSAQIRTTLAAVSR